MKTKFAVMGLVAGLYATTGNAQIVTLYQNSGYSNGDGGEFNAVSTTLYNQYGANYDAGVTAGLNLNGSSSSLQTFCVQTAVTFSPGTSYNYGIDNFPNLTWGVAWLYSQFAKGQLTGYDYTAGSGRSATAGDLQQAIWDSLSEAGGSVTTTPSIVTQFINEANAAAPVGLTYTSLVADGTLNVETLDLENSAGADLYQNQLILVPEPTTMIAGALLLLPFGASTVRILRRNRMA